MFWSRPRLPTRPDVSLFQSLKIRRLPEFLAVMKLQWLDFEALKCCVNYSREDRVKPDRPFHNFRVPKNTSIHELHVVQKRRSTFFLGSRVVKWSGRQKKAGCKCLKLFGEKNFLFGKRGTVKKEEEEKKKEKSFPLFFVFFEGGVWTKFPPSPSWPNFL